MRELEQLNADYQLLKKKFDTQEIVNDRLIRSAMKSNVDGIRKVTAVSSACGVAVILISPIFHYGLSKTSWAFVAATVVMMLVCIFFEWRNTRKTFKSNIASCNLLEFAEKVKALKAGLNKWLKIGIPMCILWIAWLFIEIFSHAEDKKLAFFFAGGCLVGAVVGGFIGLKMNRSLIGRCDEIISQIKE